MQIQSVEIKMSDGSAILVDGRHLKRFDLETYLKQEPPFDIVVNGSLEFSMVIFVLDVLKKKKDEGG